MNRKANKSDNIANVRALIAVATLVLAGASATFAAEPPQDATQVWPYLSNLPAAERQTVTENEAKREGQVTVYGVLGIDRAKFINEAFEEKYPGINVNFVRVTASEAPKKVNTEHAMGQVHHDVVIASTPILLLLKESLAPYEPITWDEFDPRFVEGGIDQGWTAISYEILPMTIAWRTDRIKSGETPPKNLEEMADPRWKGRAGVTTHLEDFIDSMQTIYGKQEAMARIEELAALDNRTYRSYGALARAVAAGEIDIAWNFGAHRAFWLKRKGVPSDFAYMEPQLGLGVTISAVKGSSNPYAAALYMDFVTSAETLELLDEVERGHVFGNTKGNYSDSLSNFPDIRIFRPLSPERFSKLNRIAEELFLR